MPQQLEYQECYYKLGHESVINAMVLSPDGRRLVTGSEDSTVLVWSTQSGATLFRIKAHSPVLSLAWLRNSRGFVFGCKNGMLASVVITEVCSPVRLGLKARLVFRPHTRLTTLSTHSGTSKRPISKAIVLPSVAYLPNLTKCHPYQRPWTMLGFGHVQQDKLKAKVRSLNFPGM